MRLLMRLRKDSYEGEIALVRCCQGQWLGGLS